MCDYSLELYKSVPAEQGETLTAHRFSSGTIGFVKADVPHDGNCATCVSPGTLLALDYPDGRCDTGVFSRIDLPANPTAGGYYMHTHRDGLILSGGAHLSLQSLPVNTRATVLMVADARAPEDVALASVPLPPAGDEPVLAIHELIG